MMHYNVTTAKSLPFRISLPYQFRKKEVNDKLEYVLPSLCDAEEFYETAVERLLHVNAWDDLAGTEKKYRLTDSHGNLKIGKVAEGDYIRILQANTNSVRGEVYQWMVVEKVLSLTHDEWESTAIRMRPANNPNEANLKPPYFYNNRPANTLVIERNGHRVLAALRGQKPASPPGATGLYEKTLVIWVKLLKLAGVVKDDWHELLSGLLQSENN